MINDYMTNGYLITDSQLQDVLMGRIKLDSCEHGISNDDICDECHIQTVHQPYMQLKEEQRTFEWVRSR